MAQLTRGAQLLVFRSLVLFMLAIGFPAAGQASVYLYRIQGPDPVGQFPHATAEAACRNWIQWFNSLEPAWNRNYYDSNTEFVCNTYNLYPSGTRAGTNHPQIQRWLAPFKITLSGPTHTRPGSEGGPSLTLYATLTPALRDVGIELHIRREAGGYIVMPSGATDSAGRVLIEYGPPLKLVGESKIDQLSADCQGCENSANMSIVVESMPPVSANQRCDDPGLSTPRPILAATGTKIKEQTDWVDSAPHDLSFTRHYASRWAARPLAGLGTEWSHRFAMRVVGAGALLPQTRTVVFGDGSSSRFSNVAPKAGIDPRSGGAWSCPPNTFCDPPVVSIDPSVYPPQWEAQGNLDSMTDTPEGIVLRRAADDSLWLFDKSTGQALRGSQRNGWAYSFTYQNGLLSKVSNAFGRSLAMSYDAGGRLAAVTTPDGQTLRYGFDNLNRLTQATNADNTSTGYFYEDTRWPSALTSIGDGQGKRLEVYVYDHEGRPVSSELAGGADRYSVAYQDAGSVITDPVGTARSYVYAQPKGSGVEGFRTKQASMPQVGQAVARRTFTVEGLVASEKDFLGVETLFTWDARRNLKIAETRAADRPEAQMTSTQWHASFRLPVLVTEAGRSTAYSYDNMGNKLSETVTDSASGEARTWAWTYNSQGLADSMTDPKGAVWTYGYDSAGNRTSSRNPLGQQTSYSYDAAGRLTGQTEPNGLVTSYSYDARGRLTAQDIGGEASSFTYGATGQLASAALPNGLQVNYSYDAAQRLTGAQDNRGNSVQYTLDAAGNRVREEVRDATGNIALVTGRIINSLNQLAAIQGSVGQTTALVYDANGEPVSATDPLNQTTRQSLDGLRRPVATSFADNTSASQAWNQLDQLARVTDPKGVQTSYQTNAFGEVLSESSPDIGTMSYRRDGSGEVTAIQDAKGALSTITRDLLGRPLEIRYAPDHVAYFNYDQGQAGYLSKIDDKSGSTSYQRDAQGRVTTKVQTVLDNPNNPTQLTVSYGYQRGELSSIAYPSGLKVFYQREAGRITGIDVQESPNSSGKTPALAPFISGLAHTALGRPRTWAWATGDTASRSFDADGRMTQSEIASYSHDAASRITAITQSLWAHRTVTAVVSGKTQTITELYQAPVAWNAGYDARNRLTGLTRAGAETRYSYDANSNRLTAIDTSSSDIDLEAAFDSPNFTQSVSQSLSIDPGSNKLLGFRQTLTKTQGGIAISSLTGQVNYSLDANGAMTSDGLRTFEYDESRRLSQVRILKDGEAAAVDYLHNALGQRVFKSEPQVEQTLPNEEELGQGFINWLRKQFGWLFAQGQGAKGSIGMSFVYDEDANLLGEYDNGSAVGKGRTEYIWLPTESGQAIPIGLYRNGKFYAVHSDHLGTPRLITDPDRKPVWQWPYSAFGNNKTTGALAATTGSSGQVTLKGTKAPVEVNLRFPGQYFDEESNLSYNYFRSYQPGTGRYSQPDPIGIAGGWNRFSYVDGNPISLIDPTGLDAMVCLYPGAGTAGHVGIGINSSSTVGLYPRSESPGLGAITGTPAAVKADSKQAEQCKAVSTTAEQDKKMADFIARTTANPGTYSLGGNNCTNFVRSVLQQAGVSTPISPGPRPYFEALPGRP